MAGMVRSVVTAPVLLLEADRFLTKMQPPGCAIRVRFIARRASCSGQWPSRCPVVSRKPHPNERGIQHVRYRPSICIHGPRAGDALPGMQS